LLLFCFTGYILQLVSHVCRLLLLSLSCQLVLTEFLCFSLVLFLLSRVEPGRDLTPILSG
jgi:hypothetical protein